MEDRISKALDMMLWNMQQLTQALQEAGGSVTILNENVTLYDFLNTCARNNIELSAVYVGNRSKPTVTNSNEMNNPSPTANDTATTVSGLRLFCKYDTIKEVYGWDVKFIAMDGNGNWWAFSHQPSWEPIADWWEYNGDTGDAFKLGDEAPKAIKSVLPDKSLYLVDFDNTNIFNEPTLRNLCN